MKADTLCYLCCLKKVCSISAQYKIAPSESISMMKRACEYLSKSNKNDSPPELLQGCMSIVNKYINNENMYAEKKYLYNKYLMEREEDIKNKIIASSKPLRLALKYAVLGNYIDFGALDDININKLDELLNNVDEIKLDESIINNLFLQLSFANNLVYITDNAGEIVLDKIFIDILKKSFVGLSVSVIMRGEAILNDATIDDGKFIGLDKSALIMGNGTNIPGTSLNKINNITFDLLNKADVIIAKGQGNFETLFGCKKNIFYLFLCKCDLFTQRFNVNKYTPIIKSELNF